MLYYRNHLFLTMKTWFEEQRFDDDVELQAGVNEWFKFQAARFYNDGINKLTQRYNKCTRNKTREDFNKEFKIESFISVVK